MFGAGLLVSGVGKIIIGKGVGTEVDGGKDWIMSSRVGVPPTPSESGRAGGFGEQEDRKNAATKNMRNKKSIQSRARRNMGPPGIF